MFGQIEAESHEIGQCSRAEFGHRLGAMNLDGARADTELPRDFAVRAPTLNCDDHFLLARRERFVTLEELPLAARALHPLEAGPQRVANGGNQSRLVDWFRKEIGGALLHDLHRASDIRAGRQDDGGQELGRLPQLRDRGDGVVRQIEDEAAKPARVASSQEGREVGKACDGATNAREERSNSLSLAALGGDDGNVEHRNKP